MRKCLCMFLAIIMLFSLFAVNGLQIQAAKKISSRDIAIVFDNSGSMYLNGEKAWCRATYAMEVFASMLNSGDRLMIYPMHPITVNGKSFTMNSPFIITSSSQASKIRDIYTENALGTPIESIDAAAGGLMNSTADIKCMIILTDGDSFHSNGRDLGKNATKRELTARIDKYAGKGMSVMYLGIGTQTVMPSTSNSDYFFKIQAKDSKDVLSALTDMCNRIFGRDTLPKNHISGNTVDFDISMRKLIVFVQGENVSNVTLKGKSVSVGKEIGRTETKYGTKGTGTFKSVPDTSLQGMLVTYENCPLGTYELQYSGKATDVEVYYEPDADMEFIFTDGTGKAVDPQALYEGEYKVSFGMKDAKTGKLIESDLLGYPEYLGNYYLNGTKIAITHSGKSGEVPINLKMGDTFKAEMTVTYLSGYTIHKDSSDFGWPSGGIKVAARPAEDLKLEISGGQDRYSLQTLTTAEPYILKVFYKDSLLTGDELKKVKLEWDPSKSNATVKAEFAGDHYKLHLDYPNPSAPQNTPCGRSNLDITAFYTAPGSSQAQDRETISYKLEEDLSKLKLTFVDGKNYFVVSKMDKSEPLVVKATLNDKPLTPEEFTRLSLKVDCGGINNIVTPDPQTSSYKIQLKSTNGLKTGKYTVKVSGSYVDNIGRSSTEEESFKLTLSTIPRWLLNLIIFLILALLILLIIMILHIKVLPKKAHVNKKDSTMTVDGEDESKSTTFLAKVEKGQMSMTSKYGGMKSGLIMSIKPGKESYLRKPQTKRSAEVDSMSVHKFGSAVITDASIAGVQYNLNEDTGKLERTPANKKPFLLKHGSNISYSGTMFTGGTQKSFNVTTKLNFKKK